MRKLAHKARILALEICYQLDIKDNFSDRKVHEILKEKSADMDIISRASRIVKGVISNLSYIDSLIKKHSINWDISRMSYVDRNILRIGIYEMIFEPEVPDVVAINEAIEIAKTYSSHDSGKFINGILDSVRKAIANNKEK
ncbi:MAG: transcription antitermination factor NusB [Candidatus Omnitrophica bacterium]|nr:transcription antitermination factor NusB [Candidatus Omnitrophota bacterium]